MSMLITGLILFVGVHFIPVFQDLHDKLQVRFGEKGYKLLFSAVSLIGIVLMFIGFGAYRDSGMIVIVEMPNALRHLSMLLMLPVFVLLLAPYSENNIKRVLKHPQILAVKIWAFAHLLVNGDLASLILFGAFLCWGVIGRISMKRRNSYTPITKEEGATIGYGMDIALIVIGLAIYLVFFFYIHQWLIGVPVI